MLPYFFQGHYYGWGIFLEASPFSSSQRVHERANHHQRVTSYTCLNPSEDPYVVGPRVCFIRPRHSSRMRETTHNAWRPRDGETKEGSMWARPYPIAANSVGYMKKNCVVITANAIGSGTHPHHVMFQTYLSRNDTTILFAFSYFFPSFPNILFPLSPNYSPYRTNNVIPQHL